MSSMTVAEPAPAINLEPEESLPDPELWEEVAPPPKEETPAEEPAEEPIPIEEEEPAPDVAQLQAELAAQQATNRQLWARFQRSKSERDAFQQQIEAISKRTERFEKYLEREEKTAAELARDAERPNPEEKPLDAFQYDIGRRFEEALEKRLGAFDERLSKLDSWREQQAADAEQRAAVEYTAAVAQTIQALPPALNEHVMKWSDQQRQALVEQGVDDRTALAEVGKSLLQFAAQAQQRQLHFGTAWITAFGLNPTDYVQVPDGDDSQTATAPPAPSAASPQVRQQRAAANKAPDSVPRGEAPRQGADPISAYLARVVDLDDQQAATAQRQLAERLGISLEELDARIEQRIQAEAQKVSRRR